MGLVKLYSARACPFAHRTRLVLSHKNIGFEIVEIDLKNKPEWFTREVSGYGKVPAIEHEGNRLWESAIINEYLEESFPHPELLPAQPGKRAQARVWTDYGNTRLAPAFGKLLRASDSSEQAAARRELSEGLQLIETKALAQLSAAGPFFFGPGPSLLDFALYPWFERWVGLEHYRDFPVSSELKRITRWRDAMRGLPAVQTHQNPPEYYIERYASIAKPAAQ